MAFLKFWRNYDDVYAGEWKRLFHGQPDDYGHATGIYYAEHWHEHVDPKVWGEPEVPTKEKQ